MVKAKESKARRKIDDGFSAELSPQNISEAEEQAWAILETENANTDYDKENVYFLETLRL